MLFLGVAQDGVAVAEHTVELPLEGPYGRGELEILTLERRLVRRRDTLDEQVERKGTKLTDLPDLGCVDDPPHHIGESFLELRDRRHPSCVRRLQRNLLRVRQRNLELTNRQRTRPPRRSPGALEDPLRGIPLGTTAASCHPSMPSPFNLARRASESAAGHDSTQYSQTVFRGGIDCPGTDAGTGQKGSRRPGPDSHADDLVADLLRVRIEIEQNPCGDTFVFTHQPEQDVLGADVVVPERPSLVLGEDDGVASRSVNRSNTRAD